MTDREIVSGMLRMRLIEAKAGFPDDERSRFRRQVAVDGDPVLIYTHSDCPKHSINYGWNIIEMHPDQYDRKRLDDMPFGNCMQREFLESCVRKGRRSLIETPHTVPDPRWIKMGLKWG